MSGLFGKKDYKNQIAGLCCVEVSGESCANCFSLMPVLKAIVDKRGDIRLVHVEADEETTALMEEWEVEGGGLGDSEQDPTGQQAWTHQPKGG